MLPLATNQDEEIRLKILKMRERMSFHEICIDVGISETTLRQFANGKKVTDKIMRELRIWSKKCK